VIKYEKDWEDADAELRIVADSPPNEDASVPVKVADRPRMTRYVSLPPPLFLA
jgi:hypothetical protein